jgi:hypothetical protein
VSRHAFLGFLEKTIWSKKDKGNLSQAERNSVANALARFENLIKTGKIR